MTQYPYPQNPYPQQPQQPPLKYMATGEPVVPPKPKRFGWPTVLITAFVSWLLGAIMILMLLSPGTPDASTYESQSNASATGTEAASQPTTQAPSLTASDFAVSLKIISKQCFDTAGCVVEYRPKIEANDLSKLAGEGTVEVSYKITGANDEIEGTFTITLGDDPQVTGQDQDVAQTPSAPSLKIKITNVDQTE